MHHANAAAAHNYSCKLDCSHFHHFHHYKASLHLPSSANSKMRSHAFSFFALTLFALLISTFSNISAAVSPTWLVRANTPTSSLENTCQCDCCYPVGLRGRTECVPPIDTSFDVAVCSKCDVDACAARFPVACAQFSSIVNSDCITRKGWMLRMVPILFIVVSFCLLCYGFFFKRFDGYHDDSVQQTTPVLRDIIHQPYNTFSQSYTQPMSRSATRSNVPTAVDKTSARSSSLLPPILETEELSLNASPDSAAYATGPSSNQTRLPSSGEPPTALRTVETTPQ